ncbi:heterodisulfide reductase, partial [candidate division MSBL1 archaeon SCGC-AAA259E19]
MSDKVGSVLVVGGGISGIQSSLNLAESGFKVYLLEDRPVVGGTMAQLDKTFPTNDCSLCILSPKLVELGRHRNVEILTYSGLEEVEGEPGNFTVTVKKHPKKVDVEECTGCGLCAEECPVEAIDEYQEGLMLRNGIYVDYSQAVPLAYTIDEEKCIGCGICEYKCEADAIEYDQEEEEVELEVGSIILSPGFEEFDPSEKEEYLFDHPNVIQSTQFERILSATGPSEGHVIRPGDGEIARKIAWIQCVGSRDKECNEYCSSVCCMYSAKQAITAMDHEEELDCTIFSMDVRAPGKEFQEYIDRAKEMGAEYIRSRPSKVVASKENNRLTIQYEEGGKPKKEEFDMVVLSVGMEPSSGAGEIERVTGIDLDDYGFAETRTFSPVQTSQPGVFVSGSFESPKDIPESITQATGAASRSSELISSEREEMTVEREYPPMKDVAGEKPRIGVFICQCGINIGGVVDVPEVTSYAESLPGVVHAENNLYTCSQDTQERIKEKIEEEDLNRVVVASCTPRTHEPLFRETCREAGL